MHAIRSLIRQKQGSELAVARHQTSNAISQQTREKLHKHRSKWDNVVNKFTRSSIESRQAMIISKIEELQNKKRKLEHILEKRHTRSVRSLDLDAKIRASASQNYFIVADHLQQVSRSLEKAEADRREYGKISRIQKFVKTNTQAIESKCRVFDSKVYDFVSELVKRKEDERDMIIRRAAVQRRRSLERI